MKKLITLSMAAFLMGSLIACGPSKAEQEEQRRQDSIRMADSLAREEAIQREKDSIEFYSFSSKDLEFFGLHGHVQSIRLDRVTYEFDFEGNLIKGCGINPFSDYAPDNYDSPVCEVPVYKRNGEGYIVLANGRVADGVDSYKWANGRLSTHSSGSGTYEDFLTCNYDETGRLISETGHFQCEGETGSASITYSYVSDDEHGNWTKRNVVYRSGGETTGAKLESRDIVYFPFQ